MNLENLAECCTSCGWPLFAPCGHGCGTLLPCAPKAHATYCHTPELHAAAYEHGPKYAALSTPVPPVLDQGEARLLVTDKLASLLVGCRRFICDRAGRGNEEAQGVLKAIDEYLAAPADKLTVAPDTGETEHQKYALDQLQKLGILDPKPKAVADTGAVAFRSTMSGKWSKWIDVTEEENGILILDIMKEHVRLWPTQKIEYATPLPDTSAAPQGAGNGGEVLRAALERIEAMSERPVCICGVPTGTAAMKACARKALAAAKSL